MESFTKQLDESTGMPPLIIEVLQQTPAYMDSNKIKEQGTHLFNVSPTPSASLE